MEILTTIQGVEVFFGPAPSEPEKTPSTDLFIEKSAGDFQGGGKVQLAFCAGGRRPFIIDLTALQRGD